MEAGKELAVFKFEGTHEVRTVVQNGEPWFVAKDVCEILELDNVTRALSTLDNDEKSSINPNITNSKVGNDGVDSPVFPEMQHGGRPLSIISESGLYALIFKSRKPQAHAFRKWVTSEVLPEIRKTGGYIATSPEDTPEMIMARAILIVNDKIQKQQAQIEEMKPKALFADAVSASHTSILVGELAKLLKQNGVKIGQNRLFSILRQDGWLIKRGCSKNMPSQRSMEQSLFEIQERTISSANGSIHIIRTPKVTGKGQYFFVNLFLKKQDEGLLDDDERSNYSLGRQDED